MNNSPDRSRPLSRKVGGVTAVAAAVLSLAIASRFCPDDEAPQPVPSTISSGGRVSRGPTQESARPIEEAPGSEMGDPQPAVVDRLIAELNREIEGACTEVKISLARGNFSDFAEARDEIDGLLESRAKAEARAAAAQAAHGRGGKKLLMDDVEEEEVVKDPAFEMDKRLTDAPDSSAFLKTECGLDTQDINARLRAAVVEGDLSATRLLLDNFFSLCRRIATRLSTGREETPEGPSYSIDHDLRDSLVRRCEYKAPSATGLTTDQLSEPFAQEYAPEIKRISDSIASLGTANEDDIQRIVDILNEMTRYPIIQQAIFEELGIAGENKNHTRILFFTKYVMGIQNFAKTLEPPVLTGQIEVRSGIDVQMDAAVDHFLNAP